LVFDRSSLRGIDGEPLAFQFSLSGGPIFLHSQVEKLQMALDGRRHTLYAIRVGGEIDGWELSRSNGDHVRQYEVSE
jgi:hypothetical protein